jgi:hypothetical protein
MKTSAKKLDEPIFVSGKLANNVLEISAIIDGRRVAVKFIGYTVMQAVKKFKTLYNIK